MRFLPIQFSRMILGFLIIISFLSIETPSQLSRKVNQLETNFEIGEAQCNFFIKLNGDYRCTFILKIVGNDRTANGLGRGEFSVPSVLVSNLTICYSTITVALPSSVEENSSVFRFALNQTIPEGSLSTIEGEFSGKPEKNKSDVYSYNLGIDWGTTVGLQKTEIKLDGNLYAIISVGPKEPLIAKLGPYLVLTWNEVFTQGFYCYLDIESRVLSPTSLYIGITSLNATIGQDLEVQMKNSGLFEIDCYILPNSSWIRVNVSKFTLTPFQEITVLFSISESIYPGGNGSIEIITIVWIDKDSNYYYLADSIIIPIYVIDGKIPNDPQTLLRQLVTVGLLFSIVIICGIAYYKREDIRLILEKKKASFMDNPASSSENMTISWESVQSKWSSILPEREMDLLELLFIHGNMNQQALADKLGLSKGTVSRIISSLEVKKLLFRERLGMSNLIKLNKDRL